MREKNAAKKLAKEKEKAVAAKQSANVAKAKTEKSSSAKKSLPKEKVTA